MSFRFFRKHQKVMLWIIVVITVFTFSIFSVTSTMRACFRERTEQIVGAFVSKTGDRVEITAKDFSYAQYVLNRMARTTEEGATRDEVLTHLILKHEAEQAGIRVSPQELKDMIAFLVEFWKSRGWIIRTKQDYERAVMANRGFRNSMYFEEALQEMLMVDKFKEFYSMTNDLTLSEDLYEKFKLDNEEFKLDFTAFPSGAYADEVKKDEIDEEELKTYYEELPASSSEVIEHYSEPEQFAFDVVYLDLAETGLEEYQDLVGEEELQEMDLRRHYQMTLDRFKIEEPEEETPEEDQDPNEAEDQEEEEEEQKEEPPKYRDFEEVKDQLEKELKLAKLVEKAHSEWAKYAREKKIIGRSVDEKEEGEVREEPDEGAEKPEPGEEDSKKGDEENAEDPGEEEEEDHEAYFDSLVEKYRLARETKETLISLDDLPDVERFGSERLKNNMRALKTNNVTYLAPNNDHPRLAFFVRVTDCVERRKKDLGEVRDLAVERFMEKKIDERTEQAARDFIAALKERAKTVEEVKGAIDSFKEEANKAVDEALKNREDLPEDAKELEKLRAEEFDKVFKQYESDINSLAERHMYKFFAEEAASKDLEIKELDYFRKSVSRTPEFREREDSPEKFLMSNYRIFTLDTNSITEPLNDRNSKIWYVAFIKDRRFPEASAMTEEEYEEYRARERQMHQELLRMKMQNPAQAKMYEEFMLRGRKRKDPFAFETVVAQYQLEVVVEEEPGEGEASTDEGSGND